MQSSKPMRLVSTPDDKSRQEQEVEIALALREKARKTEHEPFKRSEIPQSTARTADEILASTLRPRIEPKPSWFRRLLKRLSQTF